jgi:hypothetical protein
MARLIIGVDHKYLMIASGMLGALILLVADAVGMNASLPTVIPTGIMTALLGVPFFVWLIFEGTAKGVLEMIPKLDVADLRFGYHRRPVLKDIGFTIAPGRLVSLVGPNGSGKSTLLKCLLHLLKTQGGCVRVDGREIHCLSRLEVARTLTYVP